ncbi:hypothetical protein ABZ499_22105 [Streptomyces sp. NPDC019990]|uniref:hypothetical protein n=1 Tax=Streptomyces sp. NPDC019990 TaxID=3154693 RepID=UPI0033F7BE3D
MNQWREDAQTEWPEVAATTGRLRADGGVLGRRATQVFAGSDVQATGGRSPAGEEMPHGIPRQSGAGAGSPARDASTGPAVRDPWQEDAEPAGITPPDEDPAGHAHDLDEDPAGHAQVPDEVTVQLDAALGEGSVRPVEEGAGARPEAGADRPVFVDESGRRSRRFRRIGMTVAAACGLYAVVIVATLLSGNSNAPWLPVPGQKEDQPAEQVDTPALPERSAPTADTGAGAPDTTPTTDAVSAPTPGVSARRPAASARPGDRDTTAKPSPTATRTKPVPGTGATEPTPSVPADPPSTPATSPTPTAVPSPEPTVTTGPGPGDGADPGPEANGPAEPQPVANGPAEPQPVVDDPAQTPPVTESPTA